LGPHTPRILCLIVVICAAAAAAAHPPARVFTQSARVLGADGREIPAVEIDPESLDGLTELTFDLGAGRRLRLRTDLPADRLAGADALAARVRRCYAHLEAATGRRVAGGVLLYVLGFDPPPRAYACRAVLDDGAAWSQVRLALIGPGETLSGPRVSPHLDELLLDTLPHELGHHLLDARPTVRQDLDGRPPAGTRWFVEGVCESLAKAFAAREDPEAARGLLALRGVERVMSRPTVRGRLLGWHAGAPLSPDLESDVYGAALLVVRVWEAARPLPSLLAGLAATGGDHDGGALLGMLREDTGLEVVEVMERAAALGRRLLAPRPRELSVRSLPHTKTGGPPWGEPPAPQSVGARP